MVRVCKMLAYAVAFSLLAPCIAPTPGTIGGAAAAAGALGGFIWSVRPGGVPRNTRRQFVDSVRRADAFNFEHDAARSNHASPQVRCEFTADGAVQLARLPRHGAVHD